MNATNDWSLNGCLWIGQDNTEKPNNYKGYLSGQETDLETIPDDFLKHLKKQRKLEKKVVDDDPCMENTPSKLILQSPVKFHKSPCKSFANENLTFEDRQY